MCKSFQWIVGLVICLSIVSYAASYGGGSGTSDDPFLIYTAEQMNAIGLNTADWAGHFKLMADIDMSAYTGMQYNIIGNNTLRFTGTFDGNGRVISNVTINRSDTNAVGLFGSLGSGGQIINLGVENANIAGHVWTGILCGRNYYGTISQSYATGTVAGAENVGGLCGETWGPITRCYAAAAVTGSNANNGGLVGGNRYTTISQSYATGAVTGNSYTGGLVGGNELGTITQCYSTGAVSGGRPYGFCGGNYKGTIAQCFWDTQTSGRVSSSGGSGRTTAQMQTLSTFTNARWDFSVADGDAADWQIFISDYPRLTWQARLMTIQKCTVAAGKVLDSISFSGTVNISTDRLQKAVADTNDIVIQIHADAMDNPRVFTFPVTAATFKKGKLTSKTQAGSLSLETKKGKMTFSTKSADLTGLACPIAVMINIGDYSILFELDETMVNRTKPCPIQLLQGVKNTLSVSKFKSKNGKKTNGDSFTAQGTFTIAGDYDKTTDPLEIMLGSQTFTVPGALFPTGKAGIESCKKTASSEGPMVDAKFDFTKCTFSISIKNMELSETGPLPFGIGCFGADLDGLAAVTVKEQK